MPDTTQGSFVRRFGTFEINLESEELRKNGMHLRLSGQPFQVLAFLIERAGDVVTREELHSKLWSADTFVDFDHGLNNAVARIREVLDDSPDSPRYVQTIPRRGYRFIAPVTNVHSAGGRRKISIPISTRWWDRKKWAVAIAATVVLSAGLVLYLMDRRHSSESRPRISSLAVLPLKNLSGDRTQEYLADGMTEALIGRLSNIHDLRVISRTSVMQFKDTQISAPEIAKKLRVDALVEGSVMREGGHVRVHVQLIRGATDEHFWSETYDRDLGDALALDSQVAQSIARKVEVTITGKEHERLVMAHHVAPEVYESYLKGEFTQGFRRADIEKKIAYFEEAINKDSMFAPAYLGLANAYGDLGDSFVGGPTDEVRPKAISAARKALELDPQLAGAHALLAEMQQDQWQWAEAEAEYKLALDLNPNDAAAHGGLANWLLCQGRIDEALTSAQRARELDPLGVSGVQTGWILLFARRYDEAIRELRSVLAVHPDYDYALWALGSALISKGQYEDAIPVLERTVNMMERSPGSIDSLATAYGYVGRRTEALRLINELKQRRQTRYISAGAFIDPYLALGDYDEAFAWFERAYHEKSVSLQYLKVYPLYDPVRKDPRFADLLRRVGLD